MKQLIQKAIAPFGYTFRKISSLVPFKPFVRDIVFKDASFKMWITNTEANEWYSVEHWSKLAELEGLKELASPGCKVLEIGSHHGFTGLLLSRYVGDSGFVFGVEAFPQNFLVENAQLGINPEIRNLKFVHFAASDAPGKVKIAPTHNSAVTSNGENLIEVAATTADDLDAKCGPFDMLKIDVEGYEFQVLEGCKNILKRRPKIALELHLEEVPKMGHAIDELLDLIPDYEGTMALRPNEADKLIRFDPANFPTRKQFPNAPYLAANLFLKPR